MPMLYCVEEDGPDRIPVTLEPGWLRFAADRVALALAAVAGYLAGSGIGQAVMVADPYRSKKINDDQETP